MNRQLVVNLSILSERPTGWSVYTNNVVPHLASLDPLVLVRESLIESWRKKMPGIRFEPISNHLSSDDGPKGHARRLTWIETRLSARLAKLDSPLLFSPIPEAPLLRKFPTVVTAHDFIPLRYFEHRSPMYQHTKHYVPRVLRSAEHIVSNSEATATDVVRFGKVDRSKITVTPLACDTTVFRQRGLERKNFFLYVGRYKDYKNVETALRAFAELGSSSFEFWLAGPPDPGYAALLAEYRDRRGLAIKFIEYPAIEKLAELLNEGTALVYPSKWEGFGLPVLEAMACGTPVITTNVSSLPEAAGQAAILVDPSDVNGFRNAMAKLMARDQTWLELQRAGLARAAEFSWERTGTQTRVVIEAAMR